MPHPQLAARREAAAAMSEPAGPAGLPVAAAAGQQGAHRTAGELGRARSWPAAAEGTGSRDGTGPRRLGGRRRAARRRRRKPSELRGW